MAKISRPANAKALATLCARVAAEKKASSITLLNIKEIDGSPSEWFVIAECASEPQIRSLAEEMIQITKAVGVDAPRTEGWESMNWILVDYFDVVVHIMKHEAREFYKLEKLWSEAEQYELSTAGRLVKSKVGTLRKTGIESERA